MCYTSFILIIPLAPQSHTIFTAGYYQLVGSELVDPHSEDLH